VFFKANPGDGNPPVLYASFSAMGLVLADEIDALVVFDLTGPFTFDPGDRILFSLAPGSPSLGTIPGASPVGGAADVFLRRSGVAGINVFASADSLGLGGLPDRDNIDALGFRPCNDAEQCALDHGIRRLYFDCDNNGEIDLVDTGCFGACLLGPDIDYDTDGVKTVDVFVGASLQPRDVFIEPGDRVRWIWCTPSQSHRIRSGRIGAADALFNSGPAITCSTFLSPVFSQAYLAANPRAAQAYPYFDGQTDRSGMIYVQPDPCEQFDRDGDGDVDMRDFAGLQRRFGD
jgi:hypothetical protein